MMEDEEREVEALMKFQNEGKKKRRRRYRELANY